MLPSDLGKVRVGEPEPTGSQGDDDGSRRDERILLGGLFGHHLLPSWPKSAAPTGVLIGVVGEWCEGGQAGFSCGGGVVRLGRLGR
ncbi:hypothetical protein Stube_29170 [Streptomyces tubercidicus]|uniref:Uncharacterized protein n=1 Tax=Streptomyces tubercidicus TaxID=47759 RepID=A0A640US47_9ACTN|nr:hypothetical protein Stube_29170 [Streptomyces tubercidicus]